MMELLRLEHIHKRFYGRFGEVEALHDVSLTVRRGEFVSITGQSGSGKSTLMNIIGLLDTQTAGEYYLEGENVSQLSAGALARFRNRTIGFVFQDFNLIPTLTAEQNVQLPLLYRGVDKRERRVVVQRALCQVGLEQRRHHLPGELSGGQRQRVAIARAIAANPPLILADEPTGNLDPAKRDEILAIFRSLADSGHTILMITHDGVVAQAATRRLFMHEGVLSGKEV